MTDIKYMDLNEFQEEGFLQEANRLFFHPLGLALEVSDSHQNGQYDTLKIWDYREDAEGILFSNGVISERKIETVSHERNRHTSTRIDILGGTTNVQGPEDDIT